MEDKLKQRLNFLIEIDKAKTVLRQSLVLASRQENDAEHSWHMAICALTLKEYCVFKELDMKKVFELILLHDLVEIYAGDVPAFSDYSQEEKKQKELLAAKKLFSILPQEQAELYLNHWLEFENKETVESKFANACDRFQGFMQNLTSDAHTWRKFKPSRERVIQKMEDIKNYMPFVYENIVLKFIDECSHKGILK